MRVLVRPVTLALVGSGLLFQSASSVFAEIQLDSARIAQIAEWLPAQPQGVGRPITDRAAWEQLAQTPSFRSVIPKAEALAREPVPALPDDLYLDFSRTGNRDRGQAVMFARSARLVTFTLAECLENRGRFLAPLTQTIEALCRERTWVYPAHDGKLDNFYGRTVESDLRATALGWELATVDYLLGEKLSPATRQLLRENVERRVLKPFRDMAEGRRKEIWWLRVTNNWNAVCLAGTTGAALALEDSRQDRAWFIAATEQYIRFFLKSFTPDGYCSEGIGYWNYGFGHFLLLGETLREATGGHLDLLAEPEALQPALFCTRSEILNGIYPTISDVHPGSRPDAQFVCFLRERLGLGSAAASRREFVRPTGSLAGTVLFSFLEEPLPTLLHAVLPTESPLRTWFPQGGVLICRPAPGSPSQFAVALKGGNNAENHNHNDVGSFSVVSGKAMVICDPGAEVYTRRTFSAHRYDSKVLNSYGHAVPVVAGQLQRSGASARAVVLRTDFQPDADTLALDIRSAYAVPELQRLVRTFTFRRREPAELTVRGEVAFGSPQAFETALITWGTWKQVSANELIVSDDGGAVRVQVDTGGKPFKVKAETLNEHVPTRKQPVRLGITLEQPVQAADITLTIRPL